MLIEKRPVWAPEDGAGAAAAAALTTPAEAAAASAGDGAASAWWQKLPDETREFATVKGLTLDDPAEAAAKAFDMARNAERRLGHPPDRLLTKPKEGQALNEWMREHGDVFGLPPEPDGYKLDRPEGWPEDAPWDAEFEATARKLAHEHGVPQQALQAFTGLYATKVAAIEQAAKADLAAADAAMMDALRKDWGEQTDARLAQAQQAASVLAERAGLDSDALTRVAQVLADKTGDAGTIRLFQAVGEMLGEDSAVGLGKNMPMTPAAARAELAQMTRPGGAMYEANATGDGRAIEEAMRRMQTLTQLAAR